MLTKQKRFKTNTYLWYTVLFIILMGSILGVVRLSGYSLISTHDVLRQHLPIAYDYRNMMIDFVRHLSKGPTMWSWKFGLGGDVFQTYSFYVIGDPFAYLYLLVPTKWVVGLFQVLIVVRYYLAGLSFVYFTKQFKYKYMISSLAGTFAYLASGFALLAFVFQPFFLNVLILLPLLFVGIRNILQGKSIWIFTITVAFILMNNLYFAYMFAIVAFVYLILSYILNKDYRANFIKTITKFFVGAIISLGVSSWLVIPTVIGMFSSGRSTADSQLRMLFYPIAHYWNLPNIMLGSNQFASFWMPSFGLSIGIFGILYVLFNWKQYQLLGWIFSIAGIMVLFPVFASFMNGLGMPSNRWLFVLALPMAYSVTLLVEHIGDIETRTRLYITAAAIGLVAVMLILNLLNGNTVKISIPLFFVLLDVLALNITGFNEIKVSSRQVLGIIVLVNFWIWIGNMFYPKGANNVNSLVSTRIVNELIKSPSIRGLKAMEKTKNFRISYKHSAKIPNRPIIQNSSLISKFHSVNSYYSIQNAGVVRFANDMGIANHSNLVPLNDLNDRTILKKFLGVKYELKNKYTKDQAYKKLWKQRIKPKLAFVFYQPNLISDNKYNDLGMTEKEQSLFKVASISNPQKTVNYNPGKDIIDKKAELTMADGQKVDSHNISIKQPIETNHLNSKDIKKLKQYKYIRVAIPKEFKNNDNRVYLEFSHIKFTPQSTAEEIKSNATESVLSGKNKFDRSFSKKQNAVDIKRAKYSSSLRMLRKDVDLNAWSINAKYGNHKTHLFQTGITDPGATSFYRKNKNDILNMGMVTKDKKPYILLKLNHSGKYSFDLRVQQQSLNHINKDISRLNSTVRKIHIKHNKVTADVQGRTKQGIIETTIPYSKGWKARVNGKSTEVKKVNNAFIGVRPNKTGTNKVSFMYVTPGLKAGFLISVLTIGLLIVGSVIIVIKNRRA